MTPSESTISAADIVNKTSFKALYALLREGGVGKEARLVANAIMHCRPMQSTKELVDCIASVSGGSRSSDGKHPATVVFQALRIAVNNEFSEIDALLDLIPKIAAPGALVAVISFHSLEDARVAKRFRQWGQGDTTPANWRGSVKDRSQACLGILHTKTAIVPTEIEIKQNAASRSARMRVFEFYTEN
jgi:16S rRNA (cytosine1402-N4)-methyltransferase